MNPELWQQACAMAARAHRHQIRKDGQTPYVSHCVRVALTVTLLFECQDEVCVSMALLHDVLEDTTVDYDDLFEAFGQKIADGVAALSKDMRLREDVRESAYDAAIKAADWRVKLVKLADTYDNCCDVGGNPAKSLEKARRAVALALPERASHEPIDRAISLMARCLDLGQ
jgi:guanosine-3',5'-bis(diphosphate) 3'-pyrophosphohydrolase